MNLDDVKIYAAGAVGAGAPAMNWFVNFAEPLFQVFLLAGQTGVAIVTILYIWKKIRRK